jgi:hypothetical protein
MKRPTTSSVWPWLALFGVALALGLLGGGPSAHDSTLPSVRNPGARGAQVLATWLRESGTPVEILDHPLDSLSARTLVLAAGTQRELTTDEVQQLERFVREGGRLIYFSPRPSREQPELARWLKLSDAPAPGATAQEWGDVGGATIDVDSARGLLAGARKLRVSADTALKLGAPEAVPVAGQMLWWQPMGTGEVWVGAGTDLLENRRLELLDNLQLWANLRGAPIAFDEFHLTPAPAPKWSANLWVTLAQFTFVSLIFVLSRGRRLGPGRPTPVREHRSTLEYVQSMAGLMRRAGVEVPLALQLRARLRRLMQERLGIGVELPASEASLLLAAHTGLPADAWSQLDEQLGSATLDFARAAASAARLENAVVGRRTP